MAATTVRYSDADLYDFKQLIEEKLVFSRKELQFLREQMQEINENSSNQQSGDWTDESSSHTEMEMLSNSLTRQQHFVRSLENALLRIQNKTYGICTQTGNLIPKDRLRLVPHATKSIEAKNARAVPNGAPEAHAMTKHMNMEDEQPNNDHDDAVEIQKEFFDNQ